MSDQRVTSSSSRSFPFTPKSNAAVERGDYWVVPTRRGGWYGCGLVLWNGRSSGSRVMICVGLADWCGPVAPTAEEVARFGIVDLGLAHVKTIADTGSQLIGASRFVRGPTEDELAERAGSLELPSWSRDYIELRLHSVFGRHFPDAPGVAAESPPGLAER